MKSFKRNKFKNHKCEKPIGLIENAVPENGGDKLNNFLQHLDEPLLKHPNMVNNKDSAAFKLYSDIPVDIAGYR